MTPTFVFIVSGPVLMGLLGIGIGLLAVLGRRPSMRASFCPQLRYRRSVRRKLNSASFCCSVSI
jgi:hypothetical protein